MNLLQTTVLSSAAYIVRLLTGVVSTKVIAVYLGAPGVALTAHFASFLAIFQMVGNGMNTAVVKYVSEYHDDAERRSRMLATAFAIVVGSAIVVSVGLFTFSRFASLHILKSADYRAAVMIVAALIAVPAINSFFLSVLNGLKEIRRYLAFTIVTAIVGLLCTVIFVTQAGLFGALISQPVAQLAMLFGILYVGRGYSWFTFRSLLTGIDSVALPLLMRFSGMMVASALLDNVAVILVRGRIIDTMSATDAGYWQATTRISDAYMSLLVSSLSIYYLPRLSEIKLDVELKRELLHGYLIVVPGMVALALGVYVLRDQAIRLLYTDRFLPMRDLFAFQLIGDVLKMSAWLIGYVTVARAMATWFIVAEVFYNVAFVTASMIFLHWFGVIGVTYAYALSYGLLLIFLVILFRHLLFRPETLATAA